MSAVIAAQSVAEQIGQLIVEGLLVSIGVTLCFSLGLTAALRLGEARRAGHGVALAGWFVVAAAAFAAFVGFAVLGIVVVLNK